MCCFDIGTIQFIEYIYIYWYFICNTNLFLTKKLICQGEDMQVMKVKSLLFKREFKKIYQEWKGLHYTTDGWRIQTNASTICWYFYRQITYRGELHIVVDSILWWLEHLKGDNLKTITVVTFYSIVIWYIRIITISFINHVVKLPMNAYIDIGDKEDVTTFSFIMLMKRVCVVFSLKWKKINKQKNSII